MRRIAIADIHGCYHTFKALIEERLQLSKADNLFLLGDYINKGPYSKQVLEYMMQLSNTGYQLHMIRGNHDQMLIDMNKPEYSARWKNDEDLQVTLENFEVENPQDIPAQYISFLSQMPYYLFIDGYILVHAGINFEAEEPFQDYEAMLNIRQFDVDLMRTGGKKIVHGHTPIPLQEISRSLELKKEVINIDAGCSKNDDPNYGHLVALNLDSLELLYEPYRE